MIIVIKGKQYQDPDFRVEKGIASLRIPTEASFEELVADFVLEAGKSIIQLNDNEEQIGEYYVESMASIQLPGEDESEVAVIKYHVSQLGKDIQEALTDDIDMASMSVLELAGILSTAKKNFNDTASRVERSLNTVAGRADAISETLNTINVRLETIETVYNGLADRVARLENKQ